MAVVKIDKNGCRGCSLCVDDCPGNVFDSEGDPAKAARFAKVSRGDDCMGCFACYYLCPSQCIEISDVEMQRPFYRIEENVAFVEGFLQAPAMTETMTPDDWNEAHKDVSMTLVSLSQAIHSTMGQGMRALGRHAGARAAPHFPEIYEERTLEGRLQRLQERFRHSFNFDYKTDGEDLEFTFSPCGLATVVEEEAKEKIGDAVLCHLFHDYLAGLVSAYSGITYRHEVLRTGDSCVVRFSSTHR